MDRFEAGGLGGSAERVEQDAHQRKVARVVSQLRGRMPGRPLSLRKRAVSHQVPKAGDLRHKDDKIDLRDLDRILRVDPAQRICVAEPGVTFVKLVAATLKHGLVPIVVPELKTITVGGAVSGCSIESMSFRHGGFHDTCLEYEVITAQGEVLTCSPGHDPLLFEMMHGSFGTLGILSKLTFRLVPARPYVHVSYEHHLDLPSFLRSVRRHADLQDVDFMDGILHSPDHLVLCAGRFAPEAPYAHRYTWVKVYWRTTAERGEDWLRTPDYFFRYDHGVTSEWPKSFLGRLLLGKFTHSTRALRAAARLRRLLDDDRPTITLDTFVPLSRIPELFDWYDHEIGHYPLWCVPYRRVHDYEWLDDGFYRGLSDDLFLDIAIYGMKQRGERNVHRLIEKKLPELNGVKTLISHNYYSEQEFWAIFNRRNYQTVKARTDPENLFRDLYEKTCRAAMGRS
jgi:FAD/FMN-containing dehydrogenase